MNVIVIFLDSFRQDHLSIYNQGEGPFPNIPACKTPNLDKFAERCVIFENSYPEALPTIPVRCQVMTGQRTLPFRPWEPLTQQDVTMTEDGICVRPHVRYLSLSRAWNEFPRELP